MPAAAGLPMIVGLDIGTSKVVAVVGQVNVDGILEIVGVGMKPSRGMKKGVVTNIDLTMQAIQGAIAEAELMSDCHIHSVYVGIAGSHIGGRNSQAVVAIRDGEVAQGDVDRVIDAAKSGPVPADQKILHILPQEFVVDDQDDVRDPFGMSGVRLEGRIHLVTCSSNAYQNLEKCVRGCNLEVDEVILEQLASGHAVLTADERELGVCIVDIGAGTTDIAVFTQGAIRYTATIPIAGDQVTNDIAMALRTPTQDADDIKTKYACALAEHVDPEQSINVPGMGDRGARRLSRQTLAEVVEPRYDELFCLILAELERGGFVDKLPAGVVLTGGSSRIEGAVQLAESIFHLPVRIGLPSSPQLGGMVDVLRSPVYSTGVGLLMHGLKQIQEQGASLPQQKWRQDTMVEGGNFFQKMRAWVSKNF